MSHLLDVEDDLYQFIKGNISDFRETPSTVLRRLLKLPPPDTKQASSSASAPAPSVALQAPQAPNDNSSQEPSALQRFVTDPSFRLQGTATDKYLRILAFAYKQNPTSFEKILQVSGRRRKYFGRSRQEVANSGTSTHPRQIPGSGYWAMTNADTRHKCEILRKTLEVLGYTHVDVKAADGAVY